MIMDRLGHEKDESISLLASIIQGKDILSTLKSPKRNLRQLEKSLSFEVKTPDSVCKTVACCHHRCSCWYEHEYFEYIDGTDAGKIDTDLFDKILDRIRRGKCEHVGDRETEGGDPETFSDTVNGQHGENEHPVNKKRKTFITYLHAAAAVGNIKLVKYLCKQYSDYPGLRTASGLVALHLAVLKQHVVVLKYLGDKKISPLMDKNRRSLKRLPLKLYFNWNEFESHLDHDILQPVDIYTRSKVNGHLYKVDIGLYNLKTPTIALLKSIEHPSKDLLLECSNYLEDRQICDLVIHLLVHGKENEAIIMYKIIAKKCMLSLVLKIACILTDSVRFLNVLITGREDMMMLNYEYSLIDLAEAVGSYRCLGVLRIDLNNKTGTVGKRNSEAQPFIVVFYYGAISLPYLGRDFVLGFLNKLRDKGRCINRKDSSGFTPLHCVLLKNKPITYHGRPGLAFEARTRIQVCDRFEFIKRMLELGANIDALDKCDRTPIFTCMSDAAMGVVESTSNAEQIIRLLLYFNSNPKRNQNLLHYCHQYERRLYRTQLIRHAPLDESMNDAYSESEILTMTYSKSLFSVLFELGFGMQPAYALETNQKVKQMWPVFYRCVYTQPRPLLSLCRLAFRGSNPGMKLFKMLEYHQLPNSIRKYVLVEDLLTNNKT